MAAASASIINNIFEELCQKYSKETRVFGHYDLDEPPCLNPFLISMKPVSWFDLEEATILNPYCVSMKPGSNMIRCVYKRKHSNLVFFLKIEDKCKNIAHNINLMMEMSNFPQRPYRLPVEIVQHIATFLGAEEPKSRYILEDFSPHYELAYKGPLPEFMTDRDIITLYELGHVEMAKNTGNNEQKFYAKSDEAYNSGMLPYFGVDIHGHRIFRNYYIEHFFELEYWRWV